MKVHVMEDVGDVRSRAVAVLPALSNEREFMVYRKNRKKYLPGVIGVFLASVMIASPFSRAQLIELDSLAAVDWVNPSNHSAPCQEGSPYYVARQLGREAFAERHNQDLLDVLVENRPELIDVYGACVEELGMIDKLSALLNPSIYINLASLESLKELVFDHAIDAACAEIEYRAYELYGVIADVIPLGEYVYDLHDVFTFRVY